MRGEHEDGAISSDFSDDSNFDSSSSEHIEETPPSDLKTSKNEKKEKLYRNRSKSPDRYREYDTFYSSESRIRPRANSRDDTHHRSTRRIERRNQMVRSHHLRFDTISNEVYDGALKCMFYQIIIKAFMSYHYINYTQFQISFNQYSP